MLTERNVTLFHRFEIVDELYTKWLGLKLEGWDLGFI